jgi:hypothetical protein
VTMVARTVLTDQDKRDLLMVASELLEIRKLVDKISEALVNLSDKELLKAFNAGQEDVKEKQIEQYRETLEKQLYKDEKEFQPI